jgi:phosphoadenosine phosphosulfate reductase
MTDLLEVIAPAFAANFTQQSPIERLNALRAAVPGRIVFTTSLGLEDQVITHLIAASKADVDIVTLDTGRMFPETYTLWRDTEERYGVTIRPFYPVGESLERLVAKQGIDGFYTSLEARHACCEVRKVEPLGRALKDATAWITGLRADASQNRAGMESVSFDSGRNLIKFNLLFDWTRDRIAAFASQENVPISPLHAKGFLSIGCAPCTRAIAPGEPERAGRWWWEQEDAKECGLHVDADGRLIRSKSIATETLHK